MTTPTCVNEGTELILKILFSNMFPYWGDTAIAKVAVVHLFSLRYFLSTNLPMSSGMILTLALSVKIGVIRFCKVSSVTLSHCVEVIVALYLKSYKHNLTDWHKRRITQRRRLYFGLSRANPTDRD